MKIIKKQARKITLLLSITLIFVSCGHEDDYNQNQTNTNKDISSELQRDVNLYSGEELFKSIFFAHGEFARNISAYSDEVIQYEEGKMINEGLFLERYHNFVTVVNNTKPNFFRDFQNSIYSGDPLIIQNALKTGAIEIYENIGIVYPELANVIDSLEGNSEVQAILDKEGDLTTEEREFINSKAQEYMRVAIPCGPTVCVAYFALAAHNTVGLTVNVGVYAWKYFWGPALDSARLSAEDNLKNEILINDIVTAVR